jgi:hypothetical protein
MVLPVTIAVIESVNFVTLVTLFELVTLLLLEVTEFAVQFGSVSLHKTGGLVVVVSSDTSVTAVLFVSVISATLVTVILTGLPVTEVVAHFGSLSLQIEDGLVVGFEGLSVTLFVPPVIPVTFTVSVLVVFELLVGDAAVVQFESLSLQKIVKLVVVSGRFSVPLDGSIVVTTSVTVTLGLLVTAVAVIQFGLLFLQLAGLLSGLFPVSPGLGEGIALPSGTSVEQSSPVHGLLV